MAANIQVLKDKVIGKISHFIPHITKIMGLLLILYGILSFYSRYRDLEYIDTFDVIGMSVLIALGTLILLDMSFNINRAIGLYALGIGINRIMRFVPFLNPPSGLKFVFAIVMIGISVNLCITGIFFVMRTVRGRGSMMLTTAFMLVLNVGTIMFLMDTEMENLEYLFVYEPDVLALILMYVILLGMLSTESVRKSGSMERYNDLLSTIWRTNACSSDSFILSSDADTLGKAFTDRSSWKVYNDIGPVDREFVFRIFHKGDEISYVRVQKWKTSDSLYFVISDHIEGSLIDAYRFRVDELMLKDGMITMFNDDGLHMRLTVTEREAMKWI